MLSFADRGGKKDTGKIYALHNEERLCGKKQISKEEIRYDECRFKVPVGHCFAPPTPLPKRRNSHCQRDSFQVLSLQPLN